jgi:mono/diheme cytochrome c family protein
MQNQKKMLRLIAISLASFFAYAMPSYADTPYTVTDGKALDSNSYQGYKVYRQWCARCHGTFGQGGPKAPNLAESLATLSLQEYTDTVTSGKVNPAKKATKSGRMPAWKRNPTVMKNIDNIYSYLKARADGAIGTVRPRLGK